jgi:predicted CoA-substrate-specific enzyme activase
MFTLGVDIGSAASKCVILRDSIEMIGSAIINLGAGTSGPARVIKAALESGGLSYQDIMRTVATGYGRHSVNEADSVVSELSCHARGAFWLYPEARTVLDIGGQDVKALTVLSGGRLGGFVMNDKCAAGTGRFLEVMAKIMDIELDTLGSLGLMSTERVDISSTCTVFAESEVISQLSKGVAAVDLAAGINRSVAVRGAGLLRRLGITEPIFMTGGVARNLGIVRALESELSLAVQTHPLSQLAGAIGAACAAYEQK